MQLKQLPNISVMLSYTGNSKTIEINSKQESLENTD